MTRSSDLWIPHLPAALLLLFGGVAGTFASGAEAIWAFAGHLILLIFVASFGVVWPDPLRLGRAGNLLLAALILVVLASHLTSPVMRAGRLGGLLLPVFVMVPSAVARCWREEEARRKGLLSISLVTLIIATWSLVGWWTLGTAGASLPLGHHVLLAAFLLTILPLAVLPWRDGGVGRKVAVSTVVAALISLLGTGSLAAALTFALLAILTVASRRRGWWVLMVGTLLLAFQLPRLVTVVSGTDSSTAGRWSYLQAAWTGFLERPILGWGPGAARWTLAEHLQSVSEAPSADHVVADPHSLPLLIAYELGVLGLLAVAGLVLAWLRSRRCEVIDPSLRSAALLGLAALAIISCFARPLAAPAIPLAAMIVLGALLAAEAKPPAPTARRGLTLAFVAILAILILPLDLAHLAYDRATRAAEEDRQIDHLRRAVQLDPSFPLYSARLAWLEAEQHGAEAARQAWVAAERARGVAPLWSVAGILGQETGESWSREALLRSCRLNPLGVIAPYRLTFDTGPEALTTQWMARALLAEPLVSAAAAWRHRGPTLRSAVEELGRIDGVDSGWYDWLKSSVAASEQGSFNGPRVLALEMDGEVATSVSLYAFRRRPWPIDLARIEIGETASSIELGAVSPLTGAALEVLRDPSCGLGSG